MNEIILTSSSPSLHQFIVNSKTNFVDRNLGYCVKSIIYFYLFFFQFHFDVLIFSDGIQHQIGHTQLAKFDET